MAFTLLSVSCGEEGKPSYTPKPAIQMTVLSVGFESAEVEISTVNADKAFYLCIPEAESRDIEASKLPESGLEVPQKRFTINGLTDNSEYHLLAVAADRHGNVSDVARDTVITPDNPLNDVPDNPTDDPTDEPVDEPVDKEKDENGLYVWERDRTSIPTFADMALCYGGHSARNPRVWTKERFAKTVLYTDRNGAGHWLFDAMLMLEIWDDNYNVTYSIANDGKDSSRKTHWEALLDYWFDDATGFGALEACIEEAAARIGKPKTPRYIVFALPDPVYFANYTDGAEGTDRNTVYWGSIDGEQMDFSKMEHRLKAYTWYIDEIRARFAEKGYRNIELLGFYILSETLTMKGGWRYGYKQHEEIIPQVAEYCHGVNEGLYWIPYSVSEDDPGHNKSLRNWKSFGFDLAILQPNYYWDDKSWETTCGYINTYGMGMEFEFEGSHGGSTSILGNSSAGKKNKERFSAYMENAKEYGIYGKAPVVLYTGTNALYELATSEYESDQTIYHEFAQFIIDSPLKK